MTIRTDPPSSPPPDSDDELLPCGRLLSQVWAAWEERAADDHQLACPHCRRAVSDLEELETAVRRLRDDTDDIEAAAGFDAAALTQRVMDVVRLELRPGRPLPLGAPDEDMWIMESVAARGLRAAAEEFPGVRAGSCRISTDGPGSGRVTVRLDIHAPLSEVDLQGLAHRVREAVRQAADRHLGLAVTAVDIRVTELVDTPGGPGGTEKGLNG